MFIAFLLAVYSSRLLPRVLQLCDKKLAKLQQFSDMTKFSFTFFIKKAILHVLFGMLAKNHPLSIHDLSPNVHRIGTQNRVGQSAS